jgi:hypothetical protein
MARKTVDKGEKSKTRSKKAAIPPPAAPGNVVPIIPPDAPTPKTLPPRGDVPKIVSQDYMLANVEDLQLHPKNANKGDMGAIGESIEENDFYGAIIVQKSTGYILAGNHRFRSAREKNMRQVPVIVVDVDEERALKILMADNGTAKKSTTDDRAMLALAEDVKRISANGLKGTAFAETDYAKLVQKYSPPVAFPEYKGAVSVHYQCPNCGHEWS